MISVKNLSKIYKTKSSEFIALDDIDLKINTGEKIAIIGKSGSGKSTLMHILAALDKPTVGEVVFEDKNLAAMKKKELANLRNKNFGFIFQQFFLMPNESVLDNVMFPLKVAGVPRAERIQRAVDALEEVDLADKLDNKAVDLSGGQKQRVAVARAIVNEPQVIFADEPTGNLDTNTGKQIEALLDDLNEEKDITVITVTHDEDLSRRYDRQIEIRDGKIIKN